MSLEYQDEIELNTSIADIETQLMMIARRQGWLDHKGGILISNGYESIGSNILITDLTLLYNLDEGVPKVDPDIYRRFEDNDDNRPVSLFKDVAKLLRVRFGEYIVNGLINRLAEVYLPMDIVSKMEFDNPDTELGDLEEFRDFWWVLCAFQITFIGHEASLPPLQ